MSRVLYFVRLERKIILKDFLSFLQVALKVKHKIKNRKSAMQVEMDKLAEQYGVSKTELRVCRSQLTGRMTNSRQLEMEADESKSWVV